MRTDLRAVLPLLLAAGVAAACGTPSGGSPAGPAAGGTATDGPATAAPGSGPALVVEQTGGYSTPQLLAARVPLVVHADGRVLVEGPVRAVFPGPALPNVLEGRLAPEAVDRLVAAALDAGVGSDPDLGEPPVADAATTRIVVRDGGATRELEAYALREGIDVAGAPGRARERLVAFVDEASAAAQAAATTPYAPGAVAILAAPAPAPGGDTGGGTGDGLPELQQPEVPWPGPTLPGEPLVPGDPSGGSCVVARGAEADAVLAAARAADATTPWVDGGRRWSVVLRPLLPGEEGCGDLVDG